MKEENETLKAIKQAQDSLKKNSDPNGVNMEEEEECIEISDEEAADVYLRNKKDTGAREKVSQENLKCNVCNFVAKDKNLLRGHMSLHQPGSQNYQNGFLRHKDGFSCNACGENVKTMGLIRRHMKMKHGINSTPAAPQTDGARSLPNQPGRIKCDRCEFKANSREELVNHLDAIHANKPEKCSFCNMVAENKFHLMQHIQHSHMNQSRNKTSQNMPNQNYQNNKKRTVCRYWMNGNCFRGFQCSFDHPTEGTHPTAEKSPEWCHDGDNCLFWPRCKYTHEEVQMCRFQEQCRRQNCQFAHETRDFLGNNQNFTVPDIHSHQDFPPFHPNRRWW